MIKGIRQTVRVEGIDFEAWTEHGAWYEVGRVNQVGALYMPMNEDGTPDIENLGEIEVTYEDA